MSHCQGNRLGWRHTDPPFMLSKSAIIALVMSAADMTQTPMSYSDFAWGSVHFIAVRMLRSAPWPRPRLGSRLVQYICMVESLRDCDTWHSKPLSHIWISRLSKMKESSHKYVCESCYTPHTHTRTNAPETREDSQRIHTHAHTQSRTHMSEIFDNQNRFGLGQLLGVTEHQWRAARPSHLVCSEEAIQIQQNVVKKQRIMLLEISVSTWDRIHRACACELYSQQTVSTHQRGASS